MAILTKLFCQDCFNLFSSWLARLTGITLYKLCKHCEIPAVLQVGK